MNEHLENALSNAKYTSPDIQNEILEICSAQVLNNLVKDCKNSGLFSVMSDESADSSSREQLSVCVRFVFKEADTIIVREEFLGFITCKSTKGRI